MKDIRFTNTLVITTPIEKTFAYVTDLRNLPAWNYAIKSTTATGPEPIGVGKRYHQIRTVPSYAEEDVQITGYERNHHLVVSGDLGPFEAELEYQFTADGSNTRLANTVTLKASGALAFVAPIMSRNIASAVAANLQKLKSILEDF